MSAFIFDNSKSLKYRVPLCIVSIVKKFFIVDPYSRATVNRDCYNPSCIVVPKTALGLSVCTEDNYRTHDDGYEYESYVIDGTIVHLGEDDDIVERCNSFDDNF